MNQPIYTLSIDNGVVNIVSEDGIKTEITRGSREHILNHLRDTFSKVRKTMKGLHPTGPFIILDNIGDSRVLFKDCNTITSIEPNKTTYLSTLVHTLHDEWGSGWSKTKIEQSVASNRFELGRVALINTRVDVLTFGVKGSNLYEITVLGTASDRGTRRNLHRRVFDYSKELHNQTLIIENPYYNYEIQITNGVVQDVRELHRGTSLLVSMRQGRGKECTCESNGRPCTTCEILNWLKDSKEWVQEEKRVDKLKENRADKGGRTDGLK